MTKRPTLLMVLFLFISTGIYAQQLLTPSYAFSHKKIAYITLSDGTELNGYINDIDRDKGLIEAVKIKDEEGKKHKLKPEDIKFMYLPPSGMDKLSKSANFTSDVSKWNSEKLNQDFLMDGYVYFELAEVKMKKKTSKLLMQLLNPNFSKMVKVYCDPYAKETSSLKVGGVKVAGGIAKSYYLAKGDNPAYLLKKKDYDEEFTPLWESCEKVISDYPDKKWSQLVEQIITYSECQE